MKKIAIIIPAFNELDNIESLIQAILNNLPESIIFIVDDSKNKEIGNLISSKNLKAKYFHRENSKGRGSAVLFGINHVLHHMHFLPRSILHRVYLLQFIFQFIHLHHIKFYCL